MGEQLCRAAQLHLLFLFPIFCGESPLRGLDHVLILHQVLTLCLVICTSAIHLYLLTQMDQVDFRDALKLGVGSAVAFSLSMLVVWPVTALLAYHMRVCIPPFLGWDH
jgi:uncharacterized membrane protein YfcA